VRKLGRQVTVDQVLDGAERAIGTRFRDEPLTQAAVRLTLGQVYRELGQYDKAEGHMLQARALYAERLGPGHRATLATMNALGHTNWRTGNRPAPPESRPGDGPIASGVPQKPRTWGPAGGILRLIACPSMPSGTPA
jgi:hypothetical protein